MGSTEYGVGVSPLIKQTLKLEATKLNEIEKVVSLICDEMAIKESLLYNNEKDKMSGLVEAEGVYNKEIGINPVLANKFLCLVIHGLSTKYTIPAAYFMVRNLQGNDLLLLVQQVLKAVKTVDFMCFGLTESQRIQPISTHGISEKLHPDSAVETDVFSVIPRALLTSENESSNE
ncbi:hypothetical protein ANN_24590 [Periplaneta americana]|uniref:Transposable element P transposase-like RNase H domain-containing protein n=1 Tax=Periplaneta americana TaxID=6978 RepID=A0ABQ8S3F1_PERAM|nr:hypothetical protein ANN_24590 [Periplaneta americana]